MADETRAIPVTNSSEIALGMMVKDLASGLTGTAMCRYNNLAGMIQFGIQPEGDGKTLPEAMLIDWNMMTILGDGFKAAAIEPDLIAVELGDEVYDPVSKILGIATGIYTYINGCVLVDVCCQINKDGDIPKNRIDAKVLQIKRKRADLAEKAPKPQDRTNGPSGRMPRP